MDGIKVVITPSSKYELPYGKKYKAKGFKVIYEHQGDDYLPSKIAIIGCLPYSNDFHIVYPIEDVSIKLLYSNKQEMRDGKLNEILD